MVCTGMYTGSGWTKASFFLTARLNLLLLSSNSTMSVEWTILQHRNSRLRQYNSEITEQLLALMSTDTVSCNLGQQALVCSNYAVEQEQVIQDMLSR